MADKAPWYLTSTNPRFQQQVAVGVNYPSPIGRDNDRRVELQQQRRPWNTVASLQPVPVIQHRVHTAAREDNLGGAGDGVGGVRANVRGRFQIRFVDGQFELEPQVDHLDGQGAVGIPESLQVGSIEAGGNTAESDRRAR